jgi:SAM-dependent methyltransferase
MGSLSLPKRLKRLLVPVWNQAHRMGWLLRDYTSACLHGRWETCAVCGRYRPMLYRRRVIPRRLEELWGLTERLAQAFARKESSNCSACGAQLRARRMARVILKIYQPADSPASAPSLAAWARLPQIGRLRIVEINRIPGLHEQLASLPGFVFSDYCPGAGPGEVIHGVRSEDLVRLTYADNSFDLVLTSETLEHVPDLVAALAEIRRVLVPGGRHIFTIPMLPKVEKTFARMVTRADGSLEHRAPLICHPGGDSGYPVFTEFGADLPEILRGAGFEADVHFGPTTGDDMAQVYVCRKPETEPAAGEIIEPVQGTAPPDQRPPD